MVLFSMSRAARTMVAAVCRRAAAFSNVHVVLSKGCTYRADCRAAKPGTPAPLDRAVPGCGVPMPGPPYAWRARARDAPSWLRDLLHARTVQDAAIRGD